MVEIQKDGTEGSYTDAPRDQDVLVPWIADHEIPIRLAHIDRRANRQLSEGALEAAAPFGGGPGSKHDVPLERRRRDREVPGDPAIVRRRVREAVVKELASLPFERCAAPQQCPGSPPAIASTSNASTCAKWTARSALRPCVHAAWWHDCYALNALRTASVIGSMKMKKSSNSVA